MSDPVCPLLAGRNLALLSDRETGVEQLRLKLGNVMARAAGSVVSRCFLARFGLPD